MAEEKLTEEVRGIAKVVAKFVEVAKFTKDNWYILAIICGIVWKSAGFYYKANIEPQVNTYVRTIVYEMGKDSIPVMIHSELDTILSKRGVGFRTGIAIETNTPKDSVLPEYKKMYFSYLKQGKQVDTLRNFVSYTNGVIHLFVQQFFEKYTHVDGAILWITPSGDYKHFDSFGLLWDAVYNQADNCFYFYPPYTSARLRCAKYK